MASSQFASGQVLARDIAAFSDVELDHYLAEHRLEGGAASIDVQDPENLPESFIQRLKDRAQGVSDATQCRPVDLDQVTARLLQVSGDGASAKSPSRSFHRESSEVTLPPPSSAEIQTGYYNELVNDGGRPLYPVSLIEDVCGNPGAYQDMLRPWLEYPDADPPFWDVFGRQVDDWERFRRWQRLNRRPGPSRYPDEDTTPFMIADLAYNVFFGHFRRMSPNYTEALRGLLAQYDFVRSFQLHQDTTQQDKLTTWIEYLGYACAVHYRYSRLANDQRPHYDKAWKTLADSNVLRPFETEEYTRNINSAFDRQFETDQARRAVNMAESAVTSALAKASGGSKGPQHTQQACAQALLAAQSRLDAVRRSLESIEKRNSLIKDFKVAVRGYSLIEKDEKRRRVIVQWIMEQVPVVESELKKPKAAEGSSHTGRGSEPLGQNDEVMNDWSPEGHREDGQPNQRPGNSATYPTPQTAQPSEQSHSDDTANDDTQQQLPEARSGGIEKTITRGQRAARRYTRLRQSARAPATGLPSGTIPKVSKRTLGGMGRFGVGTRSSRRLAGVPPEFGMLQEQRGALTVYKSGDVLRHSAATRRSQRSAKGPKPWGVLR